MQPVAQAGTADTKSEQGLPPQVGASVITGGSEVVVGGSSVQVDVGLAVTHEQRLPTAPMTAGASMPHELTTQRMAVSWMASDWAHWQP